MTNGSLHSTLFLVIIKFQYSRYSPVLVTLVTPNRKHLFFKKILSNIYIILSVKRSNLCLNLLIQSILYNSVRCKALFAFRFVQ